MKIVLFATYAEAEATIELFHASYVGRDPFLHFETPYFHIVISGMGSYHAIAALLHHATHMTEVFNLGIAGVMDPQFLGGLHRIGSVTKYAPPLDRKSEEIHCEAFPLLRVGEGYSLVTADHPIHTPTRCDFLDMEGYCIAALSKQLHVPCTLWKYGSDQLIPGQRSLLKEALPRASWVFAQHFQSMFKDALVTQT